MCLRQHIEQAEKAFHKKLCFDTFEINWDLAMKSDKAEFLVQIW